MGKAGRAFGAGVVFAVLLAAEQSAHEPRAGSVCQTYYGRDKGIEDETGKADHKRLWALCGGN